MEESETLVSDIEKNENIVAKPRLSLFRPNLTVTAKNDIPDTNPDLAQYCEKLNSEELFWTNLYKQEKQKENMFKLKLKTHTIENIDYSLFNEDELQCLGNRPNFTAFTKVATDFIDYFNVFQRKIENIKLAQNVEMKLLEEKDNIIKEALIDLIE